MAFALDKRDIEFAILESIGTKNLLGLAPYEDFSEELIEMVITEGYKFAAEQMAPFSREADQVGCTWNDGEVRVPECYEPMYKAFCESGWFAPSMSAEYGGQGLPKIIGMALMEMFVAANSSFVFTPGLGTSAGHLIEAFGTEDLKKMYVEKMYTGTWGGTMCLTEPGAGSAVGDLTTSAAPVDGEEFFQISGNKIFISSGDHQLTDNIVHLVLARAKGDPAGIKGISLFVVPKYLVNEDGSLGEYNDVLCTGIEHKMGINASATCAMSFGDKGDCRGWLLGERCNGIKYMFQMMNEARIVTGLQGSALGNVAFGNALAYARERKQGAAVTDRTPEQTSVCIIEHADVKRNLATMKAYGEGIRALLYRAAYFADVAEHAADEEEKTRAQDMLDLLTPICKSFSSDVGFKITEIAMQVLGGYGYIQEYEVEQNMRDVKIASLYEGTNGIQALDLLGRKMRMKGGALFMTWVQDTNELLESLADHVELGPVSAEIDAAKNALGEAAFGFQGLGAENPEYPLLHASPFLRMFGLVECARGLLFQANVAYDRLSALWEAEGIKPDDSVGRKQLAEKNEKAKYYENKVLSSKFFAFQLLPEVKGILRSIQSKDTSAFEMDFY